MRVWGGTGSADDEGIVDAQAPPPAVVRAETKATLRARFVVHLKNGRTREVASYQEDGNRYRLQFLSGSFAPYPKNLIDRIEAVPTAAEAYESPEEGSNKDDAAAGTITPAERTAIVSRVIDGDTVSLESRETVRLIGIDTPETVHPSKSVEAFGKQASLFTEQELKGRKVILRFDQANAAIRHRDRYGRLLAYIVRSQDGLDFNAEIIRLGYAQAYVKYPFARLEEFRRYELDARKNGRGLWLEPIPPVSQPTVEPKPSGAFRSRKTNASDTHWAKVPWSRNATVEVFRWGGVFGRA